MCYIMFTVEDSGNCLKQLEIVTASFVLLLGYTFSISEYYRIDLFGFFHLVSLRYLVE